jgi:hypothetical protein
MIRLTHTRPATYDCDQLEVEANAAHAGCLDVNEVEPNLIAAYWNDTDAPAQSVWDSVVTAHNPAPDTPAPDPLVVLVEALQTATTIADVQAAAATAQAAIDGV